MHTYFNQHNDASVASALRLQQKLIAAVASGELVVVCDGITDALVPGLGVKARKEEISACIEDMLAKKRHIWEAKQV